MKRPGSHDTPLATERRQCGGAPRNGTKRGPDAAGAFEEKDSREGPDAAGAKRKEEPEWVGGGSTEVSGAVLLLGAWGGAGGGPAMSWSRSFCGAPRAKSARSRHR